MKLQLGSPYTVVPVGANVRPGNSHRGRAVIFLTKPAHLGRAIAFRSKSRIDRLAHNMHNKPMRTSICVLLGEDDPILGQLTLAALKSLNHDAVLATSVAEAYDHLARHHRFHIVVLDLQLGNERSEPMIERLRENGWQVPPILIFSAQPRWELDRALTRVAASSILHKPVSIEEIESEIRAVLA